MKKKVAFICVKNSCRSQMAEGFAKHYGGDIMEVYSAGTEVSGKIDPVAIEVMKEVGIDISNQRSKPISELPEKMDIVITMGCGVVCPYIPSKHMEDWGLDDPAGKPIEEYRRIRDEIEQKVKKLVERIKSGEFDQQKTTFMANQD
ncbi:arsenate reductase ArsC [Pseudothermotoga thermarum]|uniref:Protein-tyrosine phosphatase, low molecular weight n=1 Tax=Pseudothermotoga thermarum DSM 5069 TaxID=688269 RepID=F7YWS8_9THEM|nr:arsenate reductase ArsC [Pseudothermotoga thermarum]AEH50311.1 Protein-tyrosine phosphatase, low molecular weight [Pseudothermotoga thermarum DSM 5069]